MLNKIARVFLKFRNSAGAIICLGLAPSVRSFLGRLWHRFQDAETAFNLWTAAGGNVPTLVKYVSSPFFGPALVAIGLLWAAGRWKAETDGYSRTVTISDKIGWIVVILAAFMLVSVMIFDDFLSESGATQFANYVNNEKFERTLDDPTMTKLIAEFKATEKFDNIHVASVDAPEAIAYARQFMVTFLNADQKVNGVEAANFKNLGPPETARFYSPKMHGLFIAVRPGTSFEKNIEATRFAKEMIEAGLDIQLMGWEGMPEDEFKFVIGPK